MTPLKPNGIALSFAALLSLSGCIIAPLRVAAPLDVTVVDAQDHTPIVNAVVVYLVALIYGPSRVTYPLRGSPMPLRGLSVLVVEDDRGESVNTVPSLGTD